MDTTLLDFAKPHVLRTEREYDAAIAEIEWLLDEDVEPGSEGYDRLEFLSVLVERYEEERYPLAALGATPDRLLGSEIEWTGFPFESLVVHDLRVYAQPHRGQVRFYRDNKGLEVDAIVEAHDGRWIGVELKLAHYRVDEGARNLLALREKPSDETNARCGALLVVVADSPTYVRPDGVVVSSVAALGP
jgi:hypothetical protein